MEIKTFIRVRARITFFLRLLISEQNQRRVYREVLIAGDLSQDDVARATAQLGAFQVSRLQTHFSLPTLTPCQGLCPDMDLTPLWQERARHCRIRVRQRNRLLRPTRSVAVHSWRFWGRNFQYQSIYVDQSGGHPERCPCVDEQGRTQK